MNDVWHDCNGWSTDTLRRSQLARDSKRQRHNRRKVHLSMVTQVTKRFIVTFGIADRGNLVDSHDSEVRSAGAVI